MSDEWTPELPAWGFEEHKKTTFELPGSNPHENHDNTSHLNHSSQTMDVSPLSADSRAPTLDAEVGSPFSTTGWSGTADRTMPISPGTSIPTPFTYISNHEKEVVQGGDCSGNTSQRLLTQPIGFPYSPECIMAHRQTAYHAPMPECGSCWMPELCGGCPGSGLEISKSAETQCQPKDTAGQEKRWDNGPALNAMPVQVHKSPAFASPDSAHFTLDFSQTWAATSFTTPSTSLSGDRAATNFLVPHSPEKPPAMYPGKPSGEFFPDGHENVSPFAPPPSDPAAPLRCNLCSTAFTGDHRDAKNNLKRHKNQFHGGHIKHHCTMPGCNMSYPRSDYLQNHLEKFHKCLISKKTRRSKRQLDTFRGLFAPPWFLILGFESDLHDLSVIATAFAIGITSNK